MAQSTAASGTSSRRYMKEHDVVGPSSSRYVDNVWENKEAPCQRELEEARARAAQMEKTMRWWSDCTANWREKWSKVRNERNMAREETKVLRAKLEIAMKDVNSLKHESKELNTHNEQLKKEMEKIHMVLLKHAGQFDEQILSVLESDLQLTNNLGPKAEIKQDSSSCKDLLEEDNSKLNHSGLLERGIEEYVLHGAVPKHAVELYKENSNILEGDKARFVADASLIEKRQRSIEMNDEDTTLTRVQLELDEARNTIALEKEKKHSLRRTIDEMRIEVIKLESKCKELQESRSEAMRELLEMKEKFKVEIITAQADLLDEFNNREGMDHRLSELRAQLEKLQGENSAEWAKRERLETDKIFLERENKQLRNELNDLQEKIESRRIRPVSTVDTDTKQLQQEVLDRNKELFEMKHSQSKLKKLLSEKNTELSHAMRRSEQYEAEVKRVRIRVEELKGELITAQDEVDSATNSIRKLQRANEDLVEQLESIQVQLEHFKNSSESLGAGPENSHDKSNSE